MSRFFLVLTTAMMISAALAGCFSDDGDGDGGNGSGNGTTTPPDNNTTGDNNTTEEKVIIAPTPAFTVSMATFDSDGSSLDNVTGTNFTAMPGLNATFFFDGTPSTDEDGTIEAYSWQVIAPDGTEFKNSGAGLQAKMALKASSFGVFKATLKVLDSDNVLNSAEFFITLDYVNSFGLETGMSGVGQASCDTTQNEGEAGSDLGDSGVSPGTYGIHKLTIGENASALDLSLTYTDPAPTTELHMRILPPGAGDGDCGEALAEAGGASPVALSLTDFPAPGQYTIRVDLDGLQVASYSIDVSLKYAAPIQSADTPEPPAEEEGEDGEEAEQ